MKRTIMSLIGVAAALGAVTGVAAVAAPDAPRDSAAKGGTRLPVERSALLCPPPTSSEVGDTTYTAFTPKGTGGKAGAQGTAGLLPAQPGKQQDGKGKPPQDGKARTPGRARKPTPSPSRP
ncbi:Secreted protein OS=Streptomyces rimosus subsp. rimosus (strain ATCC / DSM 40260 / JCM 4667 / NRRL 2234) OX=1265868 GN=SRIM_015865 PE=4 SV=1 [Streptomyces rimosus subsp. rimosus]